MGIKDLSKYIRKNTNAYVLTHLSHLYGKKIAVDISVFLYKMIRTQGEDDWVKPMVQFLICLKKYGIKIVCVFDGPNAPPEKLKERKDRKKSRDNVAAKIENIRMLIDKVKGYIDNDYIELPRDLRNEICTACKRQRNPEKFDAIDYRDINECVRVLDTAEKKFAKQCIPITTDHADTVKEIVNYLGMAVMQADGEAETMCAYMCIKGMVDAVLTEDTDVLAYGTPLFLSKFDPRKETVMTIEHKDLIEQFDMNSPQFTDFCIMCSCDYNDRIKLPQKDPKKKQTGIGPVKAYKLLMEHGSIDNIEYCTELDITPLNYERCRVLFTIPSMYDDIILPYNKHIDVDNIKKFLRKHGCPFLFQKISETWAPTSIEFISDEENEVQCDNTYEVQCDPYFVRVVTMYEVYCDGSCISNPGPGGWASVIISGGHEKIVKGAEDNTTNNRMELMAAIQALEHIDHTNNNAIVNIHVDSQYVKNGITVWIEKWKRNGWRTANKQSVKNCDLWKQLDLLNKKHTVRWKWVKAHNGDKYNEMVDKAARSEARSKSDM